MQCNDYVIAMTFENRFDENEMGCMSVDSVLTNILVAEISILISNFQSRKNKRINGL
jgi:hypothetical protein